MNMMPHGTFVGLSETDIPCAPPIGGRPIIPWDALGWCRDMWEEGGMERPFLECQLGIGDWESLPPELVAQIYTHLPLRERKLGEMHIHFCRVIWMQSGI